MALTDSWALQEMGGAVLDTPRRLRNLVLICEKLLQNSGKSLSAALGDATRQAAYDLFSRAGRTVSDLIAGHVKQTTARCKSAPGPIVVVQDSVRLDYFTHRGCQGLGPVSAEAFGYGLWGHSALAIDQSGAVLGVLDLRFWVRDAATHGQHKERKKLPPDEKESRVWVDTLAAVEKAVPPDVPVIVVADRGGDLYTLYSMQRRTGANFVSRAYHPRRARLVQAEDSEAGGRRRAAPWISIHELWEKAPVVIPEIVVTVGKRPATVNQPAILEREVRVEVRAIEVEIAKPQTKGGKHMSPSTVRVWAVYAREKSPEPGVEAIKWLLITSLPAGTEEAARFVIETYERRWTIERVHRVLKSGLGVEKYQIDDVDSLKNALAVSWVVAWRVLQLTEAARAEPDAPADAWLEPEELEVLRAEYGKPPETLREAVRMVAKFGGWPGATRKAMPGTDVLWRGLRDLSVAVRAWRRAKAGVPAAHDTS
jgi:hypothetical protein